MPEHLTLEWTPIPNRPWVLRQPDGRAWKRFPTAQAALRWLEKPPPRGGTMTTTRAPRWGNQLARAAAGELDPGEARDLDLDAEMWPTCAVGEMRQDFEAAGYTFNPDSSWGGQFAPEDPHLYALGQLFHRAVRGRHWEAALAILEDTESLLEVP